MIVLGEVGLAGGADWLVLHAVVRFDHREPFRAKVRAEGASPGDLDVTADAFVPAVALASAVIGEPLHVEAAVDPHMLETAQRLAAAASRWFDTPRVEISASELVPSPPSRGERWLAYTRGIDSSFALLRMLDAGEPPDALWYMDGLDPNWSAPTHAENVARIREAAAAFAIPVAVGSTNLRALVDPLMRFNVAHVAVFATLPLALGRRVGSAELGTATELLIPTQVPLRTSSTCVRPCDADVRRTDKVARVAREPRAVDRLKVCWVADTAENCGRCLKCLASATMLAAHGGARALRAFPGPPTPELLLGASERLDEHPLLVDGDVSEFLETIASLPPELADVREAWQRELGGHGGAPRVVHGDDPPLGLDAAERICAAARGRALGARIESGWEGDRVPLRPLAATLERVRVACREEGSRPFAWAYVDEEDLVDPLLVSAARKHWGPGLVHSWRPGHGLTPAETRDLLRRARVRVWRGGGDRLRAGPLLSAVENGCVPLQAASPLDCARLEPLLPSGLRAVLVPLSEGGDLPVLSAADLRRRRDAILSVVLAGSLERDLALRHA